MLWHAHAASCRADTSRRCRWRRAQITSRRNRTSTERSSLRTNHQPWGGTMFGLGSASPSPPNASIRGCKSADWLSAKPVGRQSRAAAAERTRHRAAADHAGPWVSCGQAHRVWHEPRVDVPVCVRLAEPQHALLCSHACSVSRVCVCTSQRPPCHLTQPTQDVWPACWALARLQAHAARRAPSSGLSSL